MFDHEYVANLPANSHKAIIRVCNDFISNYLTEDVDFDDEYGQPLAAWSLVLELCDRADWEPPVVELTGATDTDAANISEAICEMGPEISLTLATDTVKKMRARYAAQLEGVPLYEISEEDLTLIRQRLTDLRGLIQASDVLNDDQRKRLLSRLELLQPELHNKMPNLDSIFGFIFDFSALGAQMGADAKPFIDRAKDIARIAAATYAMTCGMRASELPELLPGQSNPTVQDVVTDALMETKTEYP